MKIIQERTAFKFLLERHGFLGSFTSRTRAYYLFFSTRYIGLRVAPTTDPDLGIVELSHYDIVEILKNWDRLWKVRIKKIHNGQAAISK